MLASGSERAFSAVSACTDYFLDYSERRIRQLVGQLNKGTYRFSDYLVNDGFNETPVLIQCAATVERGSIHLDFTGTDPQMPSGKNIPMVATHSVVYCLVKMLLDPDIPPNSGT